MMYQSRGYQGANNDEKMYSMSGDYAMEQFKKVARRYPPCIEPRVVSEKQIPSEFFMAIRLQALFQKVSPVQYVQAMQDDLDCIYNRARWHEGRYGVDHAKRMISDFPNRPPVWIYFLWLIHEYGDTHED